MAILSCAAKSRAVREVEAVAAALGDLSSGSEGVGHLLREAKGSLFGAGDEVEPAVGRKVVR
jgi:hypothetical protein